MSEESEDYDTNSIESLERDIIDARKKANTIERLQELLVSLEEKADVHIVNLRDSYEVSVSIKSPEPYDEMKEIAQMDKYFKGEAHRQDDIVYLYDEELFKLTKTFKTTR